MDHLLVKIENIVDFSFVYTVLKDKYSELGRESKDPAMMIKILLLGERWRTLEETLGCQTPLQNC